MSGLTGITAEMPALSAEASPDSTCLHCGTELATDQEWCVECGAARTLIHRPTGWRIPIAIIASVVLLVLAGFAIALVSLSSTANDNTRTVSAVAAATTPAVKPPPAPKPPAAKAPAASKPAAAKPPAAKAPAVTKPTATQPTATKPAAAPAVQNAFGGWPVGLSGWTAVLYASRDHVAANAAARRLQVAGITVGVLDSSQHPSMVPGYWVVYSGRYPDAALAEAAVQRLKSQGQPRARARRVARPGGL